MDYLPSFYYEPDVVTADKPYDAQELANLAEEVLGNETLTVNLGPGMGVPSPLPTIWSDEPIYEVVDERVEGVRVNIKLPDHYDALNDAKDVLDENYTTGQSNER